MQEVLSKAAVVAWKGYRKGVNLGGWISQCPYDYSHHDTFIRKEDIQKIAAAGLDHVRVPVDYNVLKNEDGTYSEKGFGYLDACAEWCKEYGLNMVIDLHKAEGYSFDAKANSLFEDAELQNRMIALWKVIGKRYADLSDRVAYELLNEVVEQDSTRWNALLNRLIKEVREVAPDTTIVVGGIHWNSVHTLKYLELPEADRNIVLNFHFYEPFLFTHQNASWMDEMPKDEGMRYPATIEEYRAKSERINCFGSGLYQVDAMGPEYMEKLIMEAIDVAREQGRSLYCGEYGAIDNALPDDVLLWYRDVHEVFERNNVSRAAWNYKTMNFGLSNTYACKTLNDFASFL